MDRRKRIEYLIITISVFVSGFLIYGLLGMVQPIDGKKWETFLSFGILGGWFPSMIVSMIILSSCFFSKKSFRFKVIVSILWPITVCLIIWAGILLYLPYQIYNIVKIIKDKPRMKEVEQENNDNVWR